jgi:hypothetical protein
VVSGIQSSAQDVAASNTLLVLEPIGGGQVWIWDAVQKQSILAPRGYNRVGTPLDDALVFRHGEEPSRPEGWIWTRALGAFAPLVQPANGQVVPDVRSDGSVVVWIQNDEPEPSASSWPPGDLYQSPYATTAAGIEPALVRSLPSFGNVAVLGEGYYAMLDSDANIHVYRLSDGRHWTLTMPTDGFHAIRDLIYIDSEAVWLGGWESIYRQPLASLGPGD